MLVLPFRAVQQLVCLIMSHLGAAGSTGAASPGEDQSPSPAGGAFLAASAGLHEMLHSVHRIMQPRITNWSSMQSSAGDYYAPPCTKSHKEGP